MSGKKNVITVCCKCGLYAQDDGFWSSQSHTMAEDCVINNGLCPQCIKLVNPNSGKKEPPGSPK